RIGLAGILYSGCPDLWLEAVWPKNGRLRSLPLYPSPSISLPWAFRFRPFYYVAANDYLPPVCGMLFAYYFLARVEERRMLGVDPSYVDYMRRTGMFLPGNAGGRR